MNPKSVTNTTPDTIEKLFDKSNNLFLIDTDKTTVERRNENGRVLYYKYSYQTESGKLLKYKKQSIEREELIQVTCSKMTHVWNYGLDKINATQSNLICTEDAGLNLIDWVNIKPTANSYDLRGGYGDKVLRGVLQETSQFTYLLYFGLCALQEIHKKKWIHLDIKMDNICIPLIGNTQDTNEKMQLDFEKLALIDFDMYLKQGTPLEFPIEIGVSDRENLYQAPRLKSALKYKDVGAQNVLDYGVDLYAFGFTLQTIMNHFKKDITPSNATFFDKASNDKFVKKILSIIHRIKLHGEEPLDYKSIHKIYDTLLPEVENLMVEARLAENSHGKLTVTNKFSFKVNKKQSYRWKRGDSNNHQINQEQRSNKANPKIVHPSDNNIVPEATDNEAVDNTNNIDTIDDIDNDILVPSPTDMEALTTPKDEKIDNHEEEHANAFDDLFDDEDEDKKDAQELQVEKPSEKNELTVKVILSAFAIVLVILMVIILLLKLVYPVAKNVADKPQETSQPIAADNQKQDEVVLLPPENTDDTTVTSQEKPEDTQNAYHKYEEQNTEDTTKLPPSKITYDDIAKPSKPEQFKPSTPKPFQPTKNKETPKPLKKDLLNIDPSQITYEDIFNSDIKKGEVVDLN